jgi:crotonobetainyl-CoA:carnitine CoA-transferase CaiB-like acyl-CoA transferase
MPDSLPPTPAPGALAGLRVLDLSRVLAGPLCTQMLADHGADVIKVEPPSGDETRTLGPPFDAQGTAAYYLALNRGKRAMALDLSREEGREVLLRLLETSDVLVENFLPGTMERWGLGFEAVLAPRFPRLVYCSISGFGADGPLGGLPGYDAVLQAMCGLMSINGEAATGATRVGVPVVDHLTGYTAMSGILMALLARQRTGRGQRVEATLFDTALSLLLPHASNWMCSGQTPALMGSAHPNIAAYDKFRCADGEIFLGIINDGQFRRFCEHLGLGGLLADTRFATNTLRLQHRAELRATIEARLSSLEREALCSDLMRLGVPVGPVNTVPQAFEQAHAQHRGMRVQQGDYRGVGLPVKLSQTPGRAGRPPPAFGQHTDQILQEAGFDAEACNRLRASGALPSKKRSGS